MYEIKRNGITLCSQPMEEKESFILMINAGYKIYLDNKKNESKTNRQEYIEYLQEKKIL